MVMAVILASAMSFAGNVVEKKHTPVVVVTYNVHYSDTTIQRLTAYDLHNVTLEHICSKDCYAYVQEYSEMGSNYLLFVDGRKRQCLIGTTAELELVDFYFYDGQ